MDDSQRVVELLIEESDTASEEGRYQQAWAAARRAVEAAELIDDPSVLIRAVRMEADALRMLGDDAAALARYTRVLGLAEDPSNLDRLGQPAVVWAVAQAYMNWVESARFLTGVPWHRLFDVLEQAERWLEATGHRDWRAG